jgi:hypothetical protein
VTVPVKKTTKISDLIKDPEPSEATTKEEAEVTVVPPSTESEPVVEEPAQETVSPSEGELVADDKFAESWKTMFELLFREIATIYYPLKDVVPSIQHNIILVKVKNEMMKDNFESRVRLAIEYLRNNYDPRVDDISVEVDADTEPAKKVIYDTQDKMNDLKKENPDLPEFLKILNFTAKDM